MSAIGLCEHCRHMQLIANNRGNQFYLCQRSNDDASFVKYPRLPVVSCRGYEQSIEVETWQHTSGKEQ